jgi:peptidoglycan/xylan/chitin deacetylase (PgdA/CDA1 family)
MKTREKICVVLFICVTLLLGSCTKDRTDSGGVAFTFDDRYVDQWFQHRDLFNKYNVKATFFITQPMKLDDDMIAKLKILQADGHEIACHGFNHTDATTYENAAQQYIEKEILPAIEMLRELGFSVQSFAYPYGKFFPELDALLLSYFQYVRKTSYCCEKKQTVNHVNDAFIKNSSQRFMSGIGIDDIFNMSEQNLETGFKRAQKEKEIIVLYAHNIAEDVVNTYAIKPEVLERIMQLTKKYELKSIRMQDCSQFFGQNSQY